MMKNEESSCPGGGRALRHMDTEGQGRGDEADYWNAVVKKKKRRGGSDVDDG